MDSNSFYEPKANGWRALVHLPTGTFFNRHGEVLSIGKEFGKALEDLRLYLSNFEWVDCEGLERRHDILRGHLIVLDVPVANKTYIDRREELASRLPLLPCGTVSAHNQGHNYVWLIRSFGAHQAADVWDLLQEVNGTLSETHQKKIDFWEGLVAKRKDSIYPIQLHSAAEEFPYWKKHRFIN